ncbi:hypothetical protein ACSQ67_025263 [Phaseolus vulgaris]
MKRIVLALRTSRFTQTFDESRFPLSTVQKFRSEKNKVKVRRKLREPQFCFQTRSDVDVLDDGYKWRNVKNLQIGYEGKYEKRTHIKNLHHLDVKTGLQIREALKLQLDVSQRCLHKQLKVQRKLQLRIEEQGRQLK